MDVYFDEHAKEVNKPIGVESTWRISAYAAVVSDDHCLLMVQPSWNKQWELPGGGINLDESIKDGISRECLEETGYQIAVDDQPCYVGERNFFCTAHDKFYKSVIFIYCARLLDAQQDITMINSVEINEIEKIEWVNLHALEEKSVQAIIWPFVISLKNNMSHGA